MLPEKLDVIHTTGRFSSSLAEEDGLTSVVHALLPLNSIKFGG
jgi:hypothetical protein